MTVLAVRLRLCVWEGGVKIAMNIYISPSGSMNVEYTTEN